MRPETRAAALRAAAERGGLELPAEGSSMGAKIAPGDRLDVRPAPRPRPGEVWAFCTDDGKVFVHRCRRRQGEGWLFQGDRRSQADAVVPPDHLVGRVVARTRDGRRRRRFGARDRLLGSAEAALVRLLHRG